MEPKNIAEKERIISLKDDPILIIPETEANHLLKTSQSIKDKKILQRLNGAGLLYNLSMSDELRGMSNYEGKMLFIGSIIPTPMRKNYDPDVFKQSMDGIDQLIKENIRYSKVSLVVCPYFKPDSVFFQAYNEMKANKSLYGVVLANGAVSRTIAYLNPTTEDPKNVTIEFFAPQQIIQDSQLKTNELTAFHKSEKQYSADNYGISFLKTKSIETVN